MGLSKSQRYIAVSLATVVVFACCAMILKMYEENIYIAIIPSVLVLMAGISSGSNDKEKFEEEQQGCNQTINIIQNCDPSKKQIQLQPDSIKKWIEALDPKLTSECQECIIKNALKLWEPSTLLKVSHMAVDEQKRILSGLLAFDCTKQCVIPKAGLNKTDVLMWMRKVLPTISMDCEKCLIDAIMKLWSVDDFKKALSKPEKEQIHIAEGLIALHCEKCEIISHLQPDVIRKWISSLLAGTKKDCLECAVDVIVKMWDLKEFAKVNGMSKKSQVQIVHALVGLNCEKACVEIPSGLNPKDVLNWMIKNDPLPFSQDSTCRQCVLGEILRLWTPEMMKKVNAKSPLDIKKIIQGVGSLNCQTSCGQGILTKQMLSGWFKELLPKEKNINCLDCVISKALDEWKTGLYFKTKVLALPTKEQAKMARAFADFNCPHVCNLEPFEECDYLPY
jgi:hypothetical protein